MTGVHADEGQLTEERVRGNLEGEGRERLVCRRLAGEFLLFVAGIVTDHRRDVERVRQEVNNSVKHRLDTAVLEGRTTEDRVELRVDGHLADAGFDLFEGEFFTFEVLLHELFGSLGHSLNELCTVLFGLRLEVRRDFLHFVGSAHGDVTLSVARPNQGAHFEEVNNTDEVVLSTDGQLHDQRLGTKAGDDGVYGEVEVSAQLVHLVDEADTRNVVLVSLAPNSLGLRLHAFLAIEHCDCTVEDAQGALNLNREVNVARGGVNDVDLVLVPEASHGGRRDGDAAFLFLFHPVSRRSAVVRLADLVVHTRVEQDALGSGGLAGIDVAMMPMLRTLLRSVSTSCATGSPFRMDYTFAAGSVSRRRPESFYQR